MSENIVYVCRLVGGKNADNHSYAINIYNHCLHYIKKKEKVYLDFSSVETTTWGFWMTAIGTLFDDFSAAEIKAFVKIRNLSKDNLEVLGKVLLAAKDFFEYEYYSENHYLQEVKDEK